MQSNSIQNLVIFIIICTLLILTLISFVAYIVYRYQQKQNSFYRDMEELKAKHRNEMLQSQVEIQEQTFENISREIHDNIGQKLTLAKLHLNTLTLGDRVQAASRVSDVVLMITDAISDLSDISRSLSAEIIEQSGLIKALEFEVNQLNKLSLYNINMQVVGEPVFMDAQKELILFRIVQESLNNIMKHAAASVVQIKLNYQKHMLLLGINDNGKGFSTNDPTYWGTGIANMKRRAGWLNGQCVLQSTPGCGTSITIEIPVYETE
jgi:two-component system, NarL family, sensor kinase